MDAVLFRTAMSPGIREQHDAFPMIANPQGKMVVGQFGSFIYGFTQGYDGTIEDVATGLSVPTAMTFGPDGHLYVSNWGAAGAGMGQIVKITIP